MIIICSSFLLLHLRCHLIERGIKTHNSSKTPMQTKMTVAGKVFSAVKSNGSKIKRNVKIFVYLRIINIAIEFLKKNLLTSHYV